MKLNRVFFVLLALVFLVLPALGQDRIAARWMIPGGREYTQLRFSSDSNYLLGYYPGRPGLVTIWNATTKKALWEYAKTSVVGAEFSPDGQQVLISSDSQTFRFRASDGLPLGTFGSGVFGYLLTIPSKNSVLVAKSDTPVGVYNSSGGFIKSFAVTYPSANAAAGDLKASRNGAFVAAKDQVIYFVSGITALTIPLTRRAFSPDSASILTQINDKTLRLTRLSDQQTLWEKVFYESTVVEGNGTQTTETFAALESGRPADNGFFVGASRFVAHYVSGGVHSDGDEGSAYIGADGSFSFIQTTGFFSNTNNDAQFGAPNRFASSPSGLYAAFASRLDLDFYTPSSYAYWRSHPLLKLLPDYQMPANSPAEPPSALICSPPMLAETPSIAVISGSQFGFKNIINRNTGAMIDRSLITSYFVGGKGGAYSEDLVYYAVDNYEDLDGAIYGSLLVGKLRTGLPGYWGEAPISPPVFVGNRVIATTVIEGGFAGRILDIGQSGEDVTLTEVGNYPSTEYPAAGRRDGLGFLTFSGGVFSYYNLSAGGAATLKGSFPSVKVNGSDVVVNWTAFPSSGNNFNAVVVVRRGGKTYVEYRSYDVKSTTMRTLDSRTLAVYSNTWQDATVTLALSRDGTQTAVLLHRLQTVSGNAQGYVGQIDFIRNSDAAFIGRYSDQWVGHGFKQAGFTSDSRLLAVVRKDGAVLSLAVPPQLYSLSAPTTATAGSTINVTITLRGSGGPGGSPIRISYSSAGITGPSIVNVPDGAQTVTFQVTAVGPAPATVVITAKTGTDTKTATVNIQ